jgi:CHAD domain-containing protein
VKEHPVAFELQMGESVEAGVRRIVDEQLQNALDELCGADARKADAAVHGARKRFKRIRALVRLVRGGLGQVVYHRENACFRDAGGSLAEARDAAVLVQTLDGLKEQVEPAAFGLARKRLLARRRAVKKRVLESGNGLETVARTVEQARLSVAEWQITSGEGWAAIKPGLRRIFRDGRSAYERAEEEGHAELFHEWRKRVKDLWHQMEVLEAMWPGVMKGLAEEFHCLADTLGEEHDLSVLKGVLEAEALARAEEPSGVLDALEARRMILCREGKAAGARLFAEKPGAFVKRLGKYWSAWQDNGNAAEADELSAPPAEGAPISTVSENVSMPAPATVAALHEGN